MSSPYAPLSDDELESLEPHGYCPCCGLEYPTDDPHPLWYTDAIYGSER